MSVPIRVCGPRVLIKPDIEDLQPAQTESGLLIAKTLAAAVSGEDARDSWVTGTVLAIGEQDAPFDVRPFVLRRLEDLLRVDDPRVGLSTLVDEIDALPMTRPREFSVGDAVTFSPHVGQEVTLDGETYLIMQESDILGVLEGV